MIKQAPSIGRILTMVAFALSCFGILIFLWLSFGGSVPLQPEGYRVAAVFDGDECRAVAGYRLMHNLVSGYHIYVDDLVTGERWRSHGYGRELNDYLVDVASREGCASVQLDSATYRRDAHRFYFRERYSIWSFHFVRPVKEAPAQ